MTGVSSLQHPDNKAISFTTQPSATKISFPKPALQNFTSPVTVDEFPPRHVTLPPKPSAKSTPIPAGNPPSFPATTSLQNKIGRNMDEKLLGKSNQKFLSSLLPEPQSAPPNDYGKSNMESCRKTLTFT